MFYTQKQTNCLNIVSNINKTGELSQEVQSSRLPFKLTYQIKESSYFVLSSEKKQQYFHVDFIQNLSTF